MELCSNLDTPSAFFSLVNAAPFSKGQSLACSFRGILTPSRGLLASVIPPLGPCSLRKLLSFGTSENQGGFVIPDKKVDDYARDCVVRLANRVDDKVLRERLLQMAREWKAAAMDERNRSSAASPQ
jgi:hypothetical protein